MTYEPELREYHHNLAPVTLQRLAHAAGELQLKGFQRAMPVFRLTREDGR